MVINLPKEVEEILCILKQNNYEGYIVGGCVRDSLLNLIPKDWDLTTNATPEEIKECFKGYKIIETGIKHGTVTIFINNIPFEITTYRVDGKYSDNRHPDNITFTTSLKEDLSRRDFTINALAYNHEEGLIDYFNGANDIKKGIIKCVGNPNERFQEDALRIMRALRFASAFDFKIDKETEKAILKNTHLLKNIAVERIQAELNKMICGDGIDRILRNYTFVLELIIPEIRSMYGFNQNNPYHCYDVWNHTIQAIINCPKDYIIRLTMLLHDIGKPKCYCEDTEGIGHFYGHHEFSTSMAETILIRLRYDNATIKKIKDLIFYHDLRFELSPSFVKHLLNKIGEETFRQLFLVRIADIKAQNTCYFKSRMENVKTTEETLNKIIAEEQCFKIKDLAINGYDLISLGYEEGKQIGIILNELLQKVINDKVQNTKEDLLFTVKGMKGL